MKSEPINETYKVTIEFDITLSQVTEYSEISSEKLKELVTRSVEDQEFIRNAADHIAEEVMGFHQEEECIFFDYLDFNVNSYKIKTIEE